jgi:hypothetical protein
LLCDRFGKSVAFAAECLGACSLTADKIVLTPYQDQSVNLSFNDGGAEATTQFTQHGDVFTAIFKNLNGVKDTLYILIIDTITKSGYELGDLPDKHAGAVKMTCWWYQN